MTQHWPMDGAVTAAPVNDRPRSRFAAVFGMRLPAPGHPLPDEKVFEALGLRITYAAHAYPPILEAHGADGAFILIDGEVYNADAVLGPTDDVAAAILAAYRTRGTNLFAHLDMAATVLLWDARSEELLVVRDYMGHAQVFVAEANGNFIVTADLPAMLDAGVAHDMDPAALDFYLARGFVPAPLTFLRDVRRVPAATVVRVKAGMSPRFERYWQRTGEPHLDLDVEGVISEYAAFLPPAVKRRMSENTGLLLSGGVDSKTLLALAVQVSGKPIPTFTFRYGDYEGEFNESALAKACADHFGAPHTEIEVDPHEIARRLPDMLVSFGEPFSYGLHSVMLSKVRDSGIVNLIAGTGADALHLLWQERNAMRLKKWPALYRAALGPVAARLRDAPVVGERMTELHGALWSARTGLPHFVCAYMMPAAMRGRLYSDPGLLAPAREVWNHLREAALAEYQGESEITRYKFMTQRYFGTEMMGAWNHWAGRAHNVSIRSVYLDLPFIERISRLPLTRPNKLELREYASRLMPREMAYAKKLPQSAPIEVWTRGALREFVMDSLSQSRVKRSSLFSPAMVDRLIARHMSGEKDYGWQLWSILSVMAWQDVFKSGVKGGRT